MGHSDTAGEWYDHHVEKSIQRNTQVLTQIPMFLMIF